LLCTEPDWDLPALQRAPVYIGPHSPDIRAYRFVIQGHSTVSKNVFSLLNSSDRRLHEQVRGARLS
jgi:hypothetical protein